MPLYSASTYRASARKATLTPDENLIDESTINVDELRPFFDFGDDVQRNVLFRMRLNDTAIDFAHVQRSPYDGLVLCLSNSFSRHVGERLGKRACVRILNVHQLKTALDRQIGVESVARSCQYVDDHRRGIFLKSTADQWQDEYRIFCPNQQAQTVTLYQGGAEVVEIW